LRIELVCESGAGVPPVNHAQDARATFLAKLFDNSFVETYLSRESTLGEEPSGFWRHGSARGSANQGVSVVLCVTSVPAVSVFS